MPCFMMCLFRHQLAKQWTHSQPLQKHKLIFIVNKHSVFRACPYKYQGYLDLVKIFFFSLSIILFLYSQHFYLLFFNDPAITLLMFNDLPIIIFTCLYNNPFLLMFDIMNCLYYVYTFCYPIMNFFLLLF